MRDSYQEITDKIAAMLESGTCPWHQPWFSLAGDNADPRVCAMSYATGRPYSFLNQLLLGEVGEYATFAQIKKNGGSVKKGEHGRTVYFWSTFMKEKEEKDGTTKKSQIWILKAYTVFNIHSQCEGMYESSRLAKIEKAEKAAEVDGTAPKFTPREAAEKLMTDYIEREGIEFVEGYDKACYWPSLDKIAVPKRTAFTSEDHFYATVFHEMGHSTGAEKRLNRKKGGSFGSYDYGREELVAEMTSAFACADCGIDNSKITENTAAYLKSWLKSIREDPRMIVYAATKAEKAVRFMKTGERTSNKENTEKAA